MGKDIKKAAVSSNSGQKRKETYLEGVARRGRLVLPFLILILLLMLLGWGAGKVVSDLVKKTESEQESYEEEKVDPELVIKRDASDGKYVNLINTLIANNGCFGIEEYANYKSVAANEISNARAFQATSAKLFSVGEKSISEEEFGIKVKSIYGNEYSFDPKSIDYDSLSCAEYKYDESKKTFNKQKKACTNECSSYSSKFKVYNVFEQNNYLTIDIAVLFGSDDEEKKFYGDYGKTREVKATVDNYNIYIGQGDRYRFTFQMVEGHEVFVSSELINE